MEIRLGHPEFRTAVDQVRDAADGLTAARRRGATEVERLLDGGWSGEAAASFADAWESWLAGADQVAGVLRSICTALQQTERDLVAADVAAADSSTRLAERLG